MCTIAVMAIGIAFIFPFYVKYVDVLSYLAHRYEAGLLAEELFTKAEDSFKLNHSPNQSLLSGDTTLNKITYSHKMNFIPSDKSGNVCEVKVRIEWNDLKKNQISRTAYIVR